MATRSININNLPEDLTTIIPPDSSRTMLAQRALLQPVGWPRPGGGGLRLNQFSVKAITETLLWTHNAADYRGSEERRQMRLNGNTPPIQGRRDRLLQYVALAEGTENCYQSQTNANTATAAVYNMFKRAHNLRWNNKYKEPLWLLVYNTLPTAARLHQDELCGCCGALRPSIKHHFWDCIAAQTLMEQLQAISNKQITQDNIWLARPMNEISSSVWIVVCVAVVAALDSARRLAYKCTHPKRESTAIPPLNERTQLVTKHATTLFWELLADFVAVNPSPPWAKDLSSTHPFLSSTDQVTIQVVPPPSG
jgi:hypothetical protein